MINEATLVNPQYEGNGVTVCTLYNISFFVNFWFSKENWVSLKFFQMLGNGS